MEATNKQIIIIVSVVVFLLIIAFWLTYRSGKKSESNNPSNIVITDDIVGTTTLSNDDKTELKGLAVMFYEDMDGINISWDIELFQKANLLSDTKLAALSNIFNAMYQVKTGQTFLQWLQGEFMANTPLNFSVASKRSILVSRLMGIGAS